jgi:hypothetical protein
VQVKNGVAETGAQINEACIAVVDAFSSSDDLGPSEHHPHSYGGVAASQPPAHRVDPVSHANATAAHRDPPLHRDPAPGRDRLSQPAYNLPPKKPRLDPPPVLTLQEANDLKEQISQLHPDQQLQILEILQNNGEQLFPDEHGEVEIELAKCCQGSVKQVRAYLQNLKAQIKASDDTTVSSTGDPFAAGNGPVSGSVGRIHKPDSSDSDSSSDDGSSSDSSDSSSDSD